MNNRYDKYDFAHNYEHPADDMTFKDWLETMCREASDSMLRTACEASNLYLFIQADGLNDPHEITWMPPFDDCYFPEEGKPEELHSSIGLVALFTAALRFLSSDEKPSLVKLAEELTVIQGMVQTAIMDTPDETDKDG